MAVPIRHEISLVLTGFGSAVIAGLGENQSRLVYWLLTSLHQTPQHHHCSTPARPRAHASCTIDHPSVTLLEHLHYSDLYRPPTTPNYRRSLTHLSSSSPSPTSRPD